MVGGQMRRVLQLWLQSALDSLARESRKLCLVAEGPNKGLADLKDLTNSGKSCAHSPIFWPPCSATLASPLWSCSPATNRLNMSAAIVAGSPSISRKKRHDNPAVLGVPTAAMDHDRSPHDSPNASLGSLDYRGLDLWRVVDTCRAEVVPAVGVVQQGSANRSNQLAKACSTDCLC